MKVTLNNRPEEFENSQMTIQELLDKKNFTFKMLVIKINGTLVKKVDYSLATIKDGDDVIVLHLISGG